MKKIIWLISLLFLLGLIWGAHYYWHDPLPSIAHLEHPLRVKHLTEQLVQVNQEKRQYLHITFRRGKLDTFRVTISLPVNLKAKRLPVIVLLGGLEIGRKSLRYIPQQGANIVVAYEYPYRPRYWYDGTPVEQIPLIRRSVLAVPAQVTQLIIWLRQQNWADTTRISVLGYSFGALAVPAVLRVMNAHHLQPAGVIMAYGGSNLYEILKANLKTIPSIFRPFLARAISLALLPLEPAKHLPYLQGPFLLINGKFDRQIPEKSWRELHRLTPAPKDTVVLAEGHLHPKKKTLILKVIKESYQWLKHHGLIN